MAPKNSISIILTICFFIGSSFAKNLEEISPVVSDWDHAVTRDGLVRIPVQNPEGHSWFLAIKMGTPLQREISCVLENNHALSAVFNQNCDTCPHHGVGYTPSGSSTYFGKSTNTTEIRDDGFVLQGKLSMDYMCLAMYGNAKQTGNPSTTVCNENQLFFLVNEQEEWDWGARATDNKHIDAMCGLGHEKASSKAQGFVARAAHEGLIKRNAYSITFVPQKLALPVAYLPTTPQDRSQSELRATSWLTLGGWNQADYTGDIAWYRTGGSWNQVLTSFKMDGSEIIGEYDVAPVIFESGYPYIGLSPQYYDKVANILERKYHNMNCTKGEHWGVCRVKDQTCEALGLSQMLSFTIGDYQYDVPLSNIAVYVNQTKTFYCQTQIALMSRTHNAIVLGGAFYTSFVGIFDSENERIGLAQSAVTLPGSSLKCISNECDTNVDPTPIEPEVPTDGTSGDEKSTTRMVLIILGLVILTALCVVAVVWYRRKAEKEDDDDRTSRRKKSGKKGYSISDEKDDDSDEDDNLSIDYKKPMIN